MDNLKLPNKIGAIFYVLWGILHIVVGIVPVLAFLTAGPRQMLTSIPGMQAVPATIEEPLRQATFFIAQHYFNLAAVGILAIIVALTLNWNNRPLGFWTNLVVLGLVDLSFVLAEMVPGYMPLEMGIIGPILYIMGAIFTGWALVRAPHSTQERQAVSAS